MKTLAAILCLFALIPMTDDTKGVDREGDKKAVATLVKKAVNGVLVILKNDDLSRIDKREQVMKIIKSFVSFELMARRSLPRKTWKAISFT